MTPEYVAEGFLRYVSLSLRSEPMNRTTKSFLFISARRLVTQCGNGSAMAVLKGFPYMLVPDNSEALIKGMAVMAKLMERVLGVKVVNTTHLGAAFILIMFLFAVIVAWLF